MSPLCTLDRTHQHMCTPVLNLQKDEFLRLAINAIHNDLISRNEAFQSLALTFVSNSEWSRAYAELLLRAALVCVTQPTAADERRWSILHWVDV